MSGPLPASGETKRYSRCERARARQVPEPRFLARGPAQGERSHAARSLLRAGLQVEHIHEPAEHVDQLLDLGVGVRCRYLDAESDLWSWDERIGGKRRVDPVVEEEPSDGADVLMTRERHFDDGESRSVGSVHTEPFELVEDGCGLPPEIGANGITAPLVHVEADEDGRERCNRRRAGIEVRWRGGLQQRLRSGEHVRKAAREEYAFDNPDTSTTLSYVSPV